MNSHALSVLELPRVLDVVAGFATSNLGAARVRALTPSADVAHLEREHARVSAMRAALDGKEAWHPDPIPDLTDALTRLRAAEIGQRDGVPDGEVLAAVLEDGPEPRDLHS